MACTFSLKKEVNKSELKQAHQTVADVQGVSIATPKIIIPQGMFYRQGIY